MGDDIRGGQKEGSDIHHILFVLFEFRSLLSVRTIAGPVTTYLVDDVHQARLTSA